MPALTGPEVIPHRDLARKRIPVPTDWRERFLEHYKAQGAMWKAARYAGVSAVTVWTYRQHEPDFNRHVEDAHNEYLDRHACNLNRLAFKQNNVVASIVALKAGRPEYIERNQTTVLNITTQLTPEDGKALLQAMLGRHLPDQPALPEASEP